MISTFLHEDISSPVRIKDVQWNTHQHTIIVRHRMVQLTATEYRLLFPLRHVGPVTYSDLADIVYNCPVAEKGRIMLDKHIDRSRGKVRGARIYVYCVLSYGYLRL